MDISNIELIVQWRATCKLSTLWQRFGRAAQNKEFSGTAILFAEKDCFDDERAAKEARREQRKRKATTSVTSSRGVKRSKLTGNGSPQESRHQVQATSGIATDSHDGGNAAAADDEDSERELRVKEDTEPTSSAPGCNQWVDTMVEALKSRQQAEQGEK